MVLEAPAGLGKTVLLEHAAVRVRDAGCRVRRAAPGPLERHFAFGVVRALLEAPLRGASEPERTRLLDGAAAPAGALLLDGTVPDGDVTMMIAHSVLWLCSAMADERPLALLVDDAHWADRPSLEVLAYLARRIGDLPLLIAVGARADDPDAASDLLSLIGGARTATVLHPQPLTAQGAVEIIQRTAPDTPVEVCRNCHRAVRGNPWLLGELGRQLAAHGPTAIDAPPDDAPPVSAIARTVVRQRLAELTARDRAVVEAVAVIGEGAPRHIVAAVAGVPVDELGAARDALLTAGLLGAGGTRFAHHLIATAIGEDLPVGRREHLHRATARALMAAGADADTVASHLLQCGPQAMRTSAGCWPSPAAEAAQRRGPAHGSGLPRAGLRERAAGDDRGRMLAELAMVAFDAGLPDARERLREALHEAQDRASRIDVLTRLAALNVVDNDDPGLSELFERELAAEADPQTRLAIESAALDALITLPDRYEERAGRVTALIDVDVIADRRCGLHHPRAPRMAGHGVSGTPDAAACAALARAALDGDELLHDAWRRAAYHLSVRALVLTDRAEEARDAIERLREHCAGARLAAPARGGDLVFGRSRPALRPRGARPRTRRGWFFDLVDEDVERADRWARRRYCSRRARRARRLRRGARADGASAGSTARWAGHRGESAVRHARARLWLAEGDFERALAEASASGALREERGRPNPTWTPWRSTAALALAHLGRRGEAAALADAELALGERFGAPVPIAGALHARAVAEADPDARVALCRRALGVAEGTPALLESVRARLELGSTLRYTGRRVEARDALRPALADADVARRGAAGRLARAASWWPAGCVPVRRRRRAPRR